MRQLTYVTLILAYSLIAGYAVFADPIIDRAIAKIIFFALFPTWIGVVMTPHNKKEIG